MSQAIYGLITISVHLNQPRFSVDLIPIENSVNVSI